MKSGLYLLVGSLVLAGAISSCELPVSPPATDNTLPTSITVSFDKNDGSATGSMFAIQVSIGSTISLPTIGFSKTSATFAGWATTASGSVVYGNTGSYTVGNTNTTLFARWNDVGTYSVTFDKNDPDATGSMSGQSGLTGDSITLNGIGFSKAGWSFAGWATSDTGAVAYSDGSSYSIGLSSATLFAKWTANTYSVSFDKNSSFASGSTLSVSGLTGTMVSLTLNGFVNPGKRFSGWSKRPGDAISYVDGQALDVKFSNVTLYAVWSESANWSQNVRGEGNSVFLGSVITQTGDMFAVGYLGQYGSYELGNSIVIPGSAVTSGILVKYGKDGSTSWATTPVSAPAGTTTVFQCCALSGSDSLLVGVAAVTQVSGTIDFGNGVSVEVVGVRNSQFGILVKYNKSGTAEWAKVIGSSGSPNATGIDSLAVDSSGNIFAVGYVWGDSQYDFGEGALGQGTSMSANAFIAKFDSTGKTLWASVPSRAPFENQYCRFSKVKVDGLGNAVVVGVYNGPEQISFGSGVVLTGQGLNLGLLPLLVSYYSNGEARYAKSGSVSSHFNSVAVDSDSNVYAVGFIAKPVGAWADFGEGVAAEGSGYSGWTPVVVKYDASGVAKWARTALHDTVSMEFVDVSITPENRLIIVGKVNVGGGVVNFGNSVSTSFAYEGYAPVVLGMDRSGVAEWEQSVQSSNHCWYNSISTSSTGSFICTGYIQGDSNVSLGNGVIANHNNALGAGGLVVRYNIPD